MLERHDLHDFVLSSQKVIEAEYTRIRKRALEDPGTAGDQGEENWAELLRGWLPSYFHVITKGRILTERGYASPQIDVLVLTPSYPRILLDKKLYLSGGVVAAFECKTTLKAEHIRAAAKTAAELRQHLPKRTGTPYKELNSTVVYGLLAYSHSWKKAASQPLGNISKILAEADRTFAQHPAECLDFVTVADMANWASFKGPFQLQLYYYDGSVKKPCGPPGHVMTAHVCTSRDGQAEHYSPIGALLSKLFSKLAWAFTDMRHLDEYFRGVSITGSGWGPGRYWDLSAFSDETLDKLTSSEYHAEATARFVSGNFNDPDRFDEWYSFF